MARLKGNFKSSCTLYIYIKVKIKMNELILLEDLGMLCPNENSNYKKRYGLFKCYCGNEFKTTFANIKNKNTISCGCYKSKLISEKNNIVKKTHGLKSHRLYGTWKMMIHRCSNQKNISYKNYGARGITVCDEWLDINNFINDMYPTFKEGLSIDRIDNNLGYSKENCRWVEKNIQARNTRILRADNTSGYRGVCFHKASGKWVSKIRINKNDISIGSFNTALDGAKAYDKYVTDNNLEHTKNF